MKRLIFILLLISGVTLNIYSDSGGPRTTPTYDVLSPKYALPYSYTVNVNPSSQSNHYVMSRTILAGNLKPVVYSLYVGETPAGTYEIYSQKKGIGQGLSGGKITHEQAAERIQKVHGSWYYNWTFSKNDWVDPEIEFCPRNQNKLSNSANVTNAGYFGVMLNYNEPYYYGRIGNEPTIAEMIAEWPYIMSNAYLYAHNGNNCLIGSPTTEAATDSYSYYLDQFLDGISGDPTLKIDFIDFHNYSNDNDNQLVNDLRNRTDNHWAKYGLPVWITEWNIADWGDYDGFTEEKVYTETIQALHYLESDEHVARYALFPYDNSYLAGYASTTFYEYTSILAPIGELYCNFRSSDINGPYTDILYYIHNRFNCRRLQNFEGTPHTGDINTSGNSVDMSIVDAGDGYYHIVNMGKLLIDVLGVVDWTTTESGDTTKWELTPSAYGYFFIKNLGTGKRLSVTGDALRMVDVTDSTNSSKWAFPRSNPSTWDVTVIERPGPEGNIPPIVLDIVTATIIGEFLIPDVIPETVTILAESEGITRQTTFEITE